MGLFRRRRSQPQPPLIVDVTECVVPPLGERFAEIPSSPRERQAFTKAFAQEMALWELLRPEMDDGEVEWVTCRGTWEPSDHPPIPVRFYLTDRRILMYEAGRNDIFDPNLSAGHVEFWFDDIAVFNSEPSSQPTVARFLVITSESGRPEDSKATDITFDLTDEETAYFLGTAIKVMREHGGLHARMARLDEALGNGDWRPLSRHWAQTGKPVTGPEQLVPDTIYHLGYDLGRYVRTFEGLQWQGTDEEADDNERGTWHVFQPAQSTRDHGSRVSTNALRSAAQGGRPELLHIPGTQEQAAQVYELARQEHIARRKLRG